MGTYNHPDCRECSNEVSCRHLRIPRSVIWEIVDRLLENQSPRRIAENLSFDLHGAGIDPLLLIKHLMGLDTACAAHRKENA